jgi:hypothetical protein
VADPDLPTSVDVFACKSTVDNLLRFVRGEDKPFRILVEKIGNTVFFVRREHSPTGLTAGVDGFGHAFPEAYTSWDPDTQGSSSNQRLIRYRFGGLDFVLKFEADGYIAGDYKDGLQAQHIIDSQEASPMEQLEEMLVQADVSGHPVIVTDTLNISRGGRLMNQAQIFDLKTRSVRSSHEDHLAAELPRMWVAQVPKFILAYHLDGRFRDADMEVRDVRGEVRKWEKDHRSELAHLAALIHRVIHMVSDRPEHKLELHHPADKIGTLELRAQLPYEGATLSPTVRARWEKPAEGLDQIDDSGSHIAAHEHKRNREADASDRSHDSDCLKNAHGLDEHGWVEAGSLSGGLDGDDLDITACSAEDCGYCGKRATRFQR